MRYKKHVIPIYNIRFITIECSNVEELQEFLDKKTHGFQFEDASIYAHTIRTSYKEQGKLWNCIYVVFNRENSYREVTPASIAHEALHVTHMIFESIGAECDPANPECEAYLLEYIVELIYEFLDYDLHKKGK